MPVCTPRRQPSAHLGFLLSCRRIRRVRCDQTRPSCHKCLSSGRSCDGYAIAVRSGTVPILMRTPLAINIADNDDRRSLQYFKECTAREFAGLHQQDFWCETVLRVSSEEQCVLHCVIALGSLHEAFENEISPIKFGGLTAAQLHRRASYHYTEAISLSNALIISRGWDSLDVILLSCLLCVSFEWLRGSYSDAELHLTHGMNLLNEWASMGGIARTTKVPSAKEDFIHKYVAPAFNRIALQAITIRDEPLENKLLIREPSLFPGPKTNIFENMKAAHESLYNMLGQLFMARRAVCMPPRSHEAFLVRMERSIGLGRWYDCYTRSCLSMRSPTDAESSSAAFLQAKYFTVKIINETSLTDDQMTFDNYLKDFERIVKYIKIYLKSRIPSFSMDIGTVSLLHYVANRCRDPVIRREAIALNSVARREGTWDSGAAKRLSQELMIIEEGSGKPILEARDVEATSRVEKVEHQTDLKGKCMTMRFTRQGNGEWSQYRTLRW